MLLIPLHADAVSEFSAYRSFTSETDTAYAGPEVAPNRASHRPGQLRRSTQTDSSMERVPGRELDAERFLARPAHTP